MSNYTTSLGLEEINPGDQAGLWGTTTNNNLSLIDQAIAGVTPVYLDSKSAYTYILTYYNGAYDESRAAVINVTYQTNQATGANIVQIPAVQKLYVFRNSSGQDITIQTAAAAATVTLKNGEATLVFCDGANAYPGIATAGVGTITVPYGGTGQTSFTAGFVKAPGGTGALVTQPNISLVADVSGTLPVANGGTGASSFASGTLLVGNGSGNFGTLSGGSAGNVATWNGSTWTAQAPASAGVTSLSGTNLAVSNPTGAVNISLTSTGIGNALGYTPANAASVPSLSGTNAWTGANTFTGSLLYTPGGSYAGFSSNAVVVGNSSTGMSGSGSALGFQISGAGIATWTTSNATFSPQVISTSGGGYARIGDNAIAVGNTNSGMYFASNTLGWNINGSGAASLSQSGDFSISGQGYKPGGGSWAASSDARLKDNATPLTGALAKIAALNPVSYSWKYKTSEPTVGFIAQEVQSVLPAAVSETEATEDQKQFVKDGKVLAVGFQNDMTAYLVGAIKELKAELDAAKAEIAALKGAK